MMWKIDLSVNKGLRWASPNNWVRKQKRKGSTTNILKSVKFLLFQR